MSAERAEQLAARLDDIGEEIADLAIDALREALQSGSGSRPAAERALTQARRAVVKAATALRTVESAVAELRYVRHGQARALAARRSHTIGAIVRTLGVGIFAAGVEALQRRLDMLGHSLVVASLQFDPQIELRQLRILLERGIDGVVLVGHRHRADLHRLLEQTATPYVCTYSYGKGRHPCVGFDHAEAIGHGVDFLAQLGHRTSASSRARRATTTA